MTYLDDELNDELVFEPEPDEAMTERGSVPSADPRVEMAASVLRQVHESLGNVIALLEGTSGHELVGSALARLVESKRAAQRQLEDVSGSRVIEGVFDGEQMVGSDGRGYAVPPNYASKSKLVEGDMLKLTIKKDGSFVFKQIGPIERRRLVGRVAYDASEGTFVVLCGEETYRVLNASISFFRGEPGDEAVILVPKSTPSVWAAVENVVKK